MKDYSFLQIEISGENHYMISGDPKAYRMLKSDELTSFENYVAPEYRENFLKKIEEADNTWFPARIMSDTDNVFYYIRAERNESTNIIKLILVSIDELLDTHKELVNTVATYKAQLDLFEDVLFEYDPVAATIRVYNTELAHFDTGIYTLEEFEKFLSQNISDKKQGQIRYFIGQIKAKTGRFSVSIEANLLNEDPTVKSTILEGAYVFYNSGKESVVGHIHLHSSRSRNAATSIKRDSLTGLVDKADIMRIAQERIDERKLEGTTLAIIDIDFFKNINDTYGHQFGDTVIKKVAEIISTEIGNNGISGRFGGDEFLVILYNVKNETDLRKHLKGIKNTVSTVFAGKGIDEDTPLSVSIGCASFSNDAENYEDVFALADYCLYIAKEKGRNRYIIYNEQKHGTLADIHARAMTKKKFNERGELSYGDVILKMYDVTFHGKGTSPRLLMDEFADSFAFQHVGLFVGEPFVFTYSTGTENIRNPSATDYLVGMLNSDTKQKVFAERDFVVVNRVDTLPPQSGSVKYFLKEAGIWSYIMISFKDIEERECILTIVSVKKYTQWNQMHFKYYRAFVDILSRYALKDFDKD